VTDRDAGRSNAERTASRPESGLDRRVGPFCDEAGLLAHFEIRSPEVDDLVRLREVLRVRTADGEQVYPSFQFGARGALLPRLTTVLGGLGPTFLDPWEDAVWPDAPAGELGGLTPAQALLTDRVAEAVRLAEQSGAFRLG
jgi:hypothetical protein